MVYRIKESDVKISFLHFSMHVFTLYLSINQKQIKSNAVIMMYKSEEIVQKGIILL